MRIQENHLHALSIYRPTSIRHFWSLLVSLLYAKKNNFFSVTQHLPFAIEHPEHFSLLQRVIGYLFILYGELLKRIIGLPLYWENSPILRDDSWDLKYGQTNWHYVPRFVELCIDTGHLMLGAKNKNDARRRILCLFKERYNQIKHLHVHENDFCADLHWKPFERKVSERVIDQQLLEKITFKRSYIFEDPA